MTGTLVATPQQSRLMDLVPSGQHELVFALISSASDLGIAVGSGLAGSLATGLGLTVLPLVRPGVLRATYAITSVTTLQQRPMAA